MASSHPPFVAGKTDPAPHVHFSLDTCPVCEQPIPHDRADKVRKRLEARDRELQGRLKQQYDREKAREIAAALERGRQAAETAAAKKVEAAEQSQQQAQQAALSAAKELEQFKSNAEAKEQQARAEGQRNAEAVFQARITQAEQQRSDAQAAAVAAQQQLQELHQTHQDDLAGRLKEQREALETDKSAALNAERAAAFQKEQRLSLKIQELERALHKKTADELGEGAEVNLFEALKGEFEGDRIERVNRGQPGADILHTVIENGMECGKIIYDSKNHNAWLNKFVTKLRADQLAAKADHAILSTHKFPAGQSQLHMQEGVVVANPARVISIALLIRQHMIRTHALRMSNKERAEKTAALYAFITSDRCNDLLKRIETEAQALLDLQVDEQRAHERVWRRQGQLIRSVEKAGGELCREIDTIIGTARE